MTLPSSRLDQLRWVRWAIRATLALGVAASVAANILHARDNLISQTIAAWPPLALLLTVELISRVPAQRRSLGAARLAATGCIAGIAAWVSYWHMAGVAAHYGETGASPYLLPLSVDGLVVVASICLVELAGRLHPTTNHPADEVAVIVPNGQSTQDRPPSADQAPAAPAPRDDPVATGLLDRARQTATAHQTATGRDITRDELHTAVRVSNATAGELLHLTGDTGRVAPLAVPPAAFTRPNGTPSEVPQ